jgi:hypothetical protein
MAINLPNITHRPLILQDFRDIPAGCLVKMYYKRYNEGEFWWEHTRTDGQRLTGRFWYIESGWSKEGAFIYEHENVLCINSGRKPLWAIPPERWGGGAWSEEDDSDGE